MLPAVLIPWLAYHGLAVVFHSAFATDPVALLDKAILFVPLLSGKSWAISVGDIVVGLTVATGFIEVLKSSSLARGQMVDFVLTAVLFVLVLIEFLYFPWAQTSVFFFIVLALFLDLVIGYTVGVRVARRDLAIQRFAP
jgi:glucan phosphoethanolaminetransferase (alkaline phosphatase superfamily)